MRREIAGVERGVVQRDRLNQALERNQRGAGATSLRSRSILLVAWAVEERPRLGRIDCDVRRYSSWIGGPCRCRWRRGIAVAIASRVYPEAEHLGGAFEGHRYIRQGTINSSRHHCVNRRNCCAVSGGQLPLVLLINKDNKPCAVGSCGKHSPIESRCGPFGHDPGFECEVGQRWRIRRPR